MTSRCPNSLPRETGGEVPGDAQLPPGREGGPGQTIPTPATHLGARPHTPPRGEGPPGRAAPKGLLDCSILLKQRMPQEIRLNFLFQN